MRAALMRAFCDWDETKRILKMRPAPRPIDVSLSKPKRRSPRICLDEPGEQSTGAVDRPVSESQPESYCPASPELEMQDCQPKVIVTSGRRVAKPKVA